MRMKRTSPYTDFKNLKKNLEGMTFGEKVDHIWTYYKEIFFVMLLQTKRTASCIRGGKHHFYLLLSAHKGNIKVRISSSHFLPPKTKTKNQI